MSDPLPLPTQSLHRLIAGFVRRHGRAYIGSGLMLVGVAVLTVLIPRQVGRVIDGLVDGSVRGEAALLQVLLIVAMGAAIYFLRVGWRRKNGGPCSAKRRYSRVRSSTPSR